MLSDTERERIRRAYYLDHQSVSHIAQETGHCRETVNNVIEALPRKPYHLSRPRRSTVFKPFQARVEELLAQNDLLPPKQRYTAHKIFERLRAEGYQGCESRVRQQVAEWRREHQHAREVFLPLEFEPGQDAQCDWGTATVILSGQRQVAHLFVMRLCYSRRTFVMAFPTEKQESFFYGHVQAFEHFGGVPHRISYDNLATAVKLAFDQEQEGKKRRQRQEQSAFQALRSHYLFTSHFCTPGQGHEKGQVEHEVGFARRNFLVPLPEVASFEDLNDHLRRACLEDDGRRMRGRSLTIGHAWEQERAFLRPLPPFPFECCQMTSARLTPYSQVVFETNRYSVPVQYARREVTIKAYPFQVELFDRTKLLARHPRCYGRNQDVFDPLHYLSLLEQRPGAFDYAKPLKRWREGWPAAYHEMLRKLRETWPEGRGVQEFVRILQLHQTYPATLIEQAIEQALAFGAVHLDGVLHCLQHLPSRAETPMPALSTHPGLDALGTQPIDLSRYDQLLKQSW
jgi:transposase